MNDETNVRLRECAAAFVVCELSSADDDDDDDGSNSNGVK